MFVDEMSSINRNILIHYFIYGIPNITLLQFQDIYRADFWHTSQFELSDGKYGKSFNLG